MTRQKKGSHYEVVLEDRHLLVVFFAAVGLCALFFTLGFFLGRNQASEKAAAEPAAPTREAAPAAEKEQPQPADLSFYDRLEGKKPKTAAGQEKSKPAPKKAEPSPAAGLAVPPASPAAKAGIYLQVAALTQEPDAQRLAGELRKLGFAVAIRPPRRDRFYRVLVGPLENAALADAAERRLKARGFRDLIRR
ncbi:MAG: SPOR domain-containing protein [Terriglobia bacterium]